MKKTTQIGFRVSTELKEELAQIAISEHRSTSNLIEKILLDYITSYKKNYKSTKGGKRK